MKKNVSENDIQNMSQDWELDQSNNLPYSGRAVQKFIKDMLNTKTGFFYYDHTNNRYLCFADVDAKDRYLEDDTRTELILATFDAPFNYSAEINMISNTYEAVSLGTTGNYIEFSFDIKNKNGSSAGDDVMCTFTFTRGGSKKTVTLKYRSGTVVKFNIDKYLSEGTNYITVGILGQQTLAGTTMGITYQVVNLSIHDSMDISKVYNTSIDNLSLQIPFTVNGFGTKITEWFLDGLQIPFEKNVDEIVETTSTRTKYISLLNLPQGVHTIEFRAYTVVENLRFYSKLLHREFVIENPAIHEKTTMITLSYEKDGFDDNVMLLEQYVPYSITFSVYDQNNPISTSVLIFIGDSEVASIETLNGSVNKYSIIPNTSGESVIKIVANNTISTLNAYISQNRMNLEEIVSDVELNFNTVGRSNYDAVKEMWFGNGVYAELVGFNFTNTSGWVNDKLLLQSGASIVFDYAPLKNGATSRGKTIEFEFKPSHTSDDKAVLCDLIGNDGSGIKITASESKIISNEGSQLSVKYKSEENVRISFVINKAEGVTNKGLVFVYVNGVLSGAMNFSESDDFTSERNLLFSGTDSSEVILKQILVFDTPLTSDQILNNYILYRDTVDEMLQVYDRNNIYEPGTLNLSPDILQGQLPVMIVTGDVQQLENTTNKDTLITVDIDYYNLQDPSKSFTMTEAAMRPQGTSSMLYPKKNFRIYTRKNTNTVLTVNGIVSEDKLYSFKEGAQPVDCWCLKADYAESSGTHNVGVARLWNDVLVNATVEGEYVFRTQAQKTAIANGFKYDVRTTIDGFPILMFYRRNKDSDLIFIGKYNFNNDKSTESVFGFTGIDGFDNSRMQCWEMLNNGDALGLYTKVDDFDTRWQEAYESRYPDTKTPNTTDLKSFSKWVNSTKDNLDKFTTEKWDHLDVYKIAAYYVYLMRFGAVDQVVKNAMLTSEDGEHFYFINYDNDTINGLRNNGVLVFDPDIDRNSLDPQAKEDDGVYAYAGHDSVLWNMLEQDEEFMGIVKIVDNALYAAGLRYENVIKVFDEDLSSKWSERVYNKDSQYKYIDPYTNSATNNLLMLQGNRTSHRRWWLSKRFSLYDSKFVSGDFRSKVFEFKVVNNTEGGWRFRIKAGTEMEYGYGVYNPIETGIKLQKGQEHYFSVNLTLNIGDPVRIYSAANLMCVDLSEILPRLSNIELQYVWSDSLGTHLKELILGDGVKTNTTLSTISSLNKAKRLEHIDIRGCKNIKTIDLSELIYLKQFIASGSGLTSIKLPKGSGITKLQLPNTIQTLRLEQLTSLTSSGIIFEDGGKSIKKLEVVNCPNLSKNINFFELWVLEKQLCEDNPTLYVDNVDWSGVKSETFLTFCRSIQMGSLITFKGTVRLKESSQELVDAISLAFGSDVFNKTNDFYISMPDSIYMSGPDTIYEGSLTLYKCVVFSNYIGSVEYVMVTSRSGTSINSKTGLLQVNETGNNDSTITIRAIHTPTQGAPVYVDKNVLVKKLIYPSNVSIVGNGSISNEISLFSWQTTTAGVTGKVTSKWEISGDIVQYVELIVSDGEVCKIKRTSNPDTVVSGTLKVTLYSGSTGASKASSTKLIYASAPDVVVTKLENSTLMSILYNAGLSASSDFMTKSEAELVVAILINPTSSASGSIFYKKTLGNCDCFEYFTGLTEIPDFCFHNSNISSIKLPSTITRIGKFAMSSTDSTFPELVIPEGVDYLDEYAIYGNTARRKVYLPTTLKHAGPHSVDGNTEIMSSLPQNIEYMGAYAFGTHPFDIQELPQSLTYMGTLCLAGVVVSGDMYIPDGVLSLDNPFGNSPDCILHLGANVLTIAGQFNVKRVEISPDNPTYMSVDGIVYTVAVNSLNKRTVVTIPKYIEIETLVLKDLGITSSLMVKSDGIYCLQNVKTLDLLDISVGNLTGIFSNAFAAMPNLERIVNLKENSSGYAIDEYGNLVYTNSMYGWSNLLKVVKCDEYVLGASTNLNSKLHMWSVGTLVLAEPTNRVNSGYLNGLNCNKLVLPGDPGKWEHSFSSGGCKVRHIDLSNVTSNLMAVNTITSNINGLEGFTLLSATVDSLIYINLRNAKIKQVVIPEGYTSFHGGVNTLGVEGNTYIEYLDFPSTFSSYIKLEGCVNVKTLIMRKPTYTLDAYTNPFGRFNTCVGYNHRNEDDHILYIPANSSGYTDPDKAVVYALLDPNHGGFLLSATL